jgi:putative zinc finger protein
VIQPEHPSAERISDLLAGVLPAAEAMDVNAHLASCEACRDERAALLDLTALLADEGAITWEMPSDVAAAIDAAIDRASDERIAGIASLDRAPRTAARQPWRWLAGAAAAVVVVGIGFAGLRALPQQNSDGSSADSAAGVHTSPPSGAKAPPTSGYDASPHTTHSGNITQDIVGGGIATFPPRTSPRIPQTLDMPVRERMLESAFSPPIPPNKGGCAQPIAHGPSTLVRFRGHLAVLVVTEAIRVATIYDCATATKTLLVTGY